MQAAIYRRYGPPDVVRIEDVEKPVPRDNEVLIKVRAASVNPIDWHGIRGKPYIMRMGAFREPKDLRLGFDVAGQVESVGKSVTRFKPGDDVFGMCRGALAEYTCTSERAAPFSALALKPEGVTFEQAAAVGVAGLTALQGLRDKGKTQPGQKVLINGAAGGVGTFAVQIAKFFGGEVTGVSSTRNVEMVRSLGADHVIDYTRADFTAGAQRYDLVLDCFGHPSLLAARRVLKAKGVFVAASGPNGACLGPLARFAYALLLSSFVSQKLVPFIATPRGEDLTVIAELIQTGKITPVIDKRYRLSEAAEAIRHLEQGHARGKVVITLE